jgi:hypothetical protein
MLRFRRTSWKITFDRRRLVAVESAGFGAGKMAGQGPGSRSSTNAGQTSMAMLSLKAARLAAQMN